MGLSLTSVTPARNLALRAANVPIGCVVHPQSSSAVLYRELSGLRLTEELDPLFPQTLQFRTTPLGASLIGELFAGAPGDTFPLRGNSLDVIEVPEIRVA